MMFRTVLQVANLRTCRISIALGLVLMAMAMAMAVQAQDAAPAKIAVFDFELEDRSAGAGIIPPDEYDIRYLAESKDQAEHMLADSKRFTLVDTKDADLSATQQFGIRNCNGCEAGIARKLGAQQAMLGVVTRVNRTEHTMFIRILDVDSGKIVARGFTDLRMGANYAWPRSVKWVMEKQILAEKK